MSQRFRSVHSLLKIHLVFAVLATVTISTGFAYEKDADGFWSLFNGNDLTGWEGDSKLWSVEDGVIVGKTTNEDPIPHNTFLIWRDGEVDDFELHFSYRIINGNSGVQYRSKEMKDAGNFVVGGYQADFEAGDTYSGIVYEERGRGILSLRGDKTKRTGDGKNEVTGKIGETAELQKSIKKEDWNEYVIVAKGNHITHTINGQLMTELVDEESAKAARSGIVAFQLHRGPAMTLNIKDIKLKRLPLEDKKKIVLVAGTPSHAPMDHEFNAGCLLLKKCFDESYSDHVLATVYLNGWPKDRSAFDNADSIVVYMDGGGRHPMIRPENLKQVGEHMARGVGLALLHYGCEVPKDNGGKEALEWIGGYYETDFSYNPHWTADLNLLEGHPATSGVPEFSIKDEWYFNIRFREGMEGVASLMKGTPPDEVRRIDAVKQHLGREETLGWVVERPDGGRGFGFTGGHYHLNWGNDHFRKFIMNTLVWTAKGEVPKDGIESTVTEEELYQNLDPKGQRR